MRTATTSASPSKHPALKTFKLKKKRNEKQSLEGEVIHITENNLSLDTTKFRPISAANKRPNFPNVGVRKSNVGVNSK